MNVFSGCGLGGTSLVNANVSLRPDPRVFQDEWWPQALRADGEGLGAGFARAEAMLSPTTYPTSFPPLAKMEALRRRRRRRPWYPTPINVTFRAGPNAAGVHQEACTGCGDCVTGCNVGAKNTLLMNYLPDAVATGRRSSPRSTCGGWNGPTPDGRPDEPGHRGRYEPSRWDRDETGSTPPRWPSRPMW